MTFATTGMIEDDELKSGCDNSTVRDGSDLYDGIGGAVMTVVVGVCGSSIDGDDDGICDDNAYHDRGIDVSGNGC